MTHFHKITKFIFLGFLCIGLFSPVFSYAATLYMAPGAGTYKVGDTISVKIIVSSPNQSVNAVSSNISFSNNTLSLSSISKISSIISLWAQDPNFSNSSGTANLEGVILNGYTGSYGTVATLNFRVINTGDATISFNGASVLANDGEGTNVLTGSSGARYTIAQNNSNEPAPVPGEVKETTKPIKANTISVEEIKSKNINQTQARFIITAQNKDPDVPYNIQIDSFNVYEWNDPSGSHIYETIALTHGNHLIKVSTKDLDGKTLSVYKNFAINGLATPVVTEYPESILVGESFSIKGLADPEVKIAFSINKINEEGVTSSTFVGESTAKKNGSFTFRYEDPGVKGIYNITLKAYNEEGLESEETEPFRIVVKENKLTIWEKITKFLIVFIPAMGLMILLVFILTYAWYRYRKYRMKLVKDLIQTESLVKKSFSLLHDDIHLGKDKQFVDEINKDLDEAEKMIIKDLKDVEKDI